MEFTTFGPTLDSSNNYLFEYNKYCKILLKVFLLFYTLVCLYWEFNHTIGGMAGKTVADPVLSITK